MKKIVYVDDLVELNYHYVSAIENSRLYHVFLAETIEKTLEFFDKHHDIKLVVLDIDMPVPKTVDEPLRTCWQEIGEPENSYGMVLIEWLAKSNKNIPIILLSAVPSRYDEFRQRFGDISTIDRLTETPSDLLDEINSLI